MSLPNSKLPNLGYKTEEFVMSLEKNSAKPLYEMTPQDARKFLNTLQENSTADANADMQETVIFTETADSIPVCIVRPENNKEKLPVIVYIHGGGWVLGNKKTHSTLIKKLAVKTNSVVIFPEYTLSPEAQYPTAINQIYAVLDYIWNNPEEFNINKDKIVLAGDSAGGNMAAVTALKSKNLKGPKIVFQCLFYPVTNADMDTKSYEDFKDGPWLTKKAMEWFWDSYAPEKKMRDDAYISPLKAEPEDLQNLPPALIITAENDVLRDEGEAFARKLDMVGVDVLNIRINGTIHDFLMLNALSNTPQAAGALQIACNAIINSYND